MKKIMAFVLSIMMILTVAPGLAMAAQTNDAHVTYEEPTYLLYEDFEDELEGWRFVDADEDGYAWMHSQGSGAYEGEGYLESY
ncbi:MAG: hypothetical protein IJO93_03275, partial [Clostridia bacterium]|nr:hypothetical protein [Clostridia bacterium]